MRRLFATPLWLAALALILAMAPLRDWMADPPMPMTMAASDAADPGDCTGCAGDEMPPGVCMASCVIPLGVIAASQPFVRSSAAASFSVASDKRLAGVFPLPDPPRPKRLLRA